MVLRNDLQLGAENDEVTLALHPVQQLQSAFHCNLSSRDFAFLDHSQERFRSPPSQKSPQCLTPNHHSMMNVPLAKYISSQIRLRD
ncbi:hypothetical protein NC651_039632 [Populus alba x Populus x berolinensis]|nr:hypothetical protein NC651_039632 [Populus alba x Populus x berolinensis]